MENENRKLTLLSFVLFSTICAYVFYLIMTQIVDWLKMGGGNVLFGQPWVVVGGTIAGIFGLVLLIYLSVNQTTSTFVDEVFSELKKTTWPNMKDTSASTVVVSVMVGIAAFVLFVLDYFWQLFFRFIL